MSFSRPNIVLITADSLRADRLGCYGYSKPTSPNLDNFASKSTLFRQAFTTGPNTPHAFPAIMAGRSALRSEKLGLFDDEQTLAEALKAAGYATFGFNAGNPYVSRRFKYDRGFDEFHDFTTFGDGKDGALVFGRCGQTRASTAHINIPTGDLEDYLVSEASIKGKAHLELQFNPTVFDFLQRKASAPFFLWLHFMDTHYPYLPQLAAQHALEIEPVSKEENLRLNMRVRESMQVSDSTLQRINDLYDAAVRQLDAKIGEVLSFLQNENLYENTLVIFVADHGEEFLEHGDLQHKSKLYDELLHVPLLVKLPGQTRGEIRTGLFSTLQLPSTIAAVAGVQFAFAAPSLLSSDRELRGVFGGASYGANGGTPVDSDMFHIDRMPRVYSLRTNQWKLLFNSQSKRFQLFNLITDPGETADIFSDSVSRVQHLCEILKAHVIDLEHKRIRQQIPKNRSKFFLQETSLHAV